MKLIFKYLKPYLFFVLAAPAFMLLEVVMDLMQPAIMAGIIDTGIKTGNLPVILTMGSRMLLVAALGLIGGIGCTTNASFASTGFGRDLRNTLYNHIQGLSFKDLGNLKTGNLVTLLTNDVIQLEEVSGMMLRIMVRAPLLVAGSFIMALLISPSLSLIFLVLVPLLLAGFIVIIRTAYPLFIQVQAGLDRINSRIQENLAGRRLVKAFVREEWEKEKFGRANNALVDIMTRAAKRVALVQPAMQILLNLGIVLVLWGGAGLVRDSTLQIGKLIAFINYLTQMLWSLMMISNIIIRFSRVEVSAARIGAVLALEKEKSIADNNPENNRKPVKTGLEFAGVCFAYDGSLQNPVLEDISFTARPGETVAILGATGSGKTTLALLIPGFYEVTAGAIYLDGMDIRSLDPACLRRNTGIVFQESLLFRGSIRRNILYGVDTAVQKLSPEECDRRMTEAAETAMIADFISTLPDKYDTDINQRGLNLSGGQKQRLAIARAVAARTSVLILDDATSSVDVATERLIHEAMSRSLPGQIRIIIAQRISTVLQADTILLLENGKMAGTGTHAQLLASNAIYKDIYASQYGNRKDMDGE